MNLFQFIQWMFSDTLHGFISSLVMGAIGIWSVAIVMAARGKCQ